MAQIPLGNFDQVRVSPQPGRSRVDLSGTLAPGQAAEQLGGTIAGAGASIARGIAQRQAEAKAKADALARVDAVNASADYEIQVAAAQSQFGEELAAGKVDFRTADEAWGQRLSALEPPKPPANADEVITAQFNGALHQTQQRARLKMQGLATTAQQAHFETAALDALNKAVMLAGMPGGNTEEAIARTHALLPVIRAAGYDEAKASELVEKTGQAIYTNEAKGRIVGAGDSRESLDAVLHDLTAEDGRYTSTLTDPNNRLVLANAVRSRLHELDTAQQQAADKREEAAKRVVSDVWTQATSGVRPTANMLTDWATTVKDTPYAAEFAAATQALVDVQGVLRQSPEQQAAYVQDLRTKLAADGGTPQDQARIDKIETVIEGSNKQRDSDPLLWLANMTGKAAEPIDLQAALTSGDFSGLGSAVQSRMDSIAAVRGQYGPSVAVHPLLPQEAQGLAKIVQSLAPDQLPPLFGTLRDVIGSDAAYSAVMEQIAPNAPLKAYAGQIAVRPGGGKTASLILRGDALLNDKDGKAKWPMPPDGQFTKGFLDIAGNAYQGRPDALQRDLAAARAVYAASAAQDGASEAGKEFDPERFAHSVQAVVGEVAEIGPTRVTVPWGTPVDVFTERATTLASDALKAAGLDPDADGIGLMATSRPGRYILVQGRTPVWNPGTELNNGRLMPVFIDWVPPTSDATRTRKVTDAALEATRRGTR